MVEKIWALVFALAVLISVPATASAASCGDGACEAGEDCLACPDDCGGCNGAPCASDGDCASNICCDGICESSCVVYLATRPEGISGLFLSDSGNVLLFEAALLAAAIALILVLWKRRKSAKS